MNSPTETLQVFYAAINRFDIPVIFQDFDPHVVRTEPSGFPTAGTYRGIEEVQANVIKGRGSWAEGSCDPEGIFIKGNKVVVYLHAWVRMKGATDWMGGRFADGFVFQGDKIIEYHSFGERSEALQWAGLEATQAD